MNGQGWELVQQVAIIIGTLAAGGPGAVWFVGWAKQALGISGRPVYVLAAAVSLIVALAAMILDGVISPERVSTENLAEIALGLFFASQAYYRMIEQRQARRLAEYVERDDE